MLNTYKPQLFSDEENEAGEDEQKEQLPDIPNKNQNTPSRNNTN